MKELEKSKTLYKSFKGKVKVYVADDGKEFNKKVDCIGHETKTKTLNQIKTIDIKSMCEDYPDKFYFINNKSTLKFLLKYLDWNNNETHLNNTVFDAEDLIVEGYPDHIDETPKVGELIGRSIEYGNDDPDTYNFFTLKYIQGQLQSSIDEIKLKLKNKK